MLSAGEKTAYVTIVRDTITRSTDDGSEVRTPATIASRWASIKPISGRERQASQQTQSSVSYRIQMDYLADVQQQDRVVWATASLTLQVIAVLQEPQMPEWKTTLDCEVRRVS